MPLVAAAQTEPNEGFNKIFDRYADWQKTVRLFSCILRIGCPQHSKFRGQNFGVEEKEATEKFLFRKAQEQHFRTEIDLLKRSENADLKNSALRDYNPAWDPNQRLLISMSRLTQSSLPLETRCPILLPKNCKVTEKFVLHLHSVNFHAGPEHVLSLLRQRFRLLQGRRQVKGIIRKCLQKHCTKPRPLHQQMSPLPSLRMDDAEAFKNVSVDLFGPMHTSHRCQLNNCPHPVNQKVYGAIFTCFHSRAIHLELLEDQSTDSFLSSFRRFCGRRGTPTVMFSDCATNFKKASKEIKTLYRSINWTKVAEDGRIKSIEWIFNVEKAPWGNAIAERMIRAIKPGLRIVVGNAKLTYNQLATILIECEGIINSRPLGMVSDHPDDLTPITPAELIIGRKMTHLPDPNPRKTETNLVHLWRKRQATLNAFWKRWQKDYLLNQDLRKKWHKPANDQLLNQVVLLKEDNMSRNEWRLARIIQTFPSKDGLIRSVLVKTPTSTLRRPVQKLALLENVF